MALCYKQGTRVHILDEEIPPHLEMIIFRYFDAIGEPTLAFGCYRPPCQGCEIFNYILENQDRLSIKWKTKNMLIVGDLNPRSVKAHFDNFLDSLNLENHVDFPTHISGSSLDPVLSDLHSSAIKCSSQGYVGSSDHVAVLAEIAFRRPRDEKFTRTLWLWKDADWAGLRTHLKNINWDDIFTGRVEEDVQSFSETILKAQATFVPSKLHTQRTSDQPWFGVQCRNAAKAKHQAWRRFKAHPSERNKQRHREASRRMDQTQSWAVRQWKDDVKKKVSEGSVGSKLWWNLIKNKQGINHDSVIPPLILEDGQCLLTSQSKADAFGEFYAQKMQVDDPDRPPPTIPSITKNKIEGLELNSALVLRQLRQLNPQKATGPDGIGPLILKMCAEELAQPLCSIYRNCLEKNTWPSYWKCSSIIPVHKKGVKSLIKNYRPVALLPVAGKVFEHLIHAAVNEHLLKNRIISSRQHGFLKARSAADLHLLMSARWAKALDQGLQTLVLAVDIEGAFDRVWHEGLITKLESVGIGGKVLPLLASYLKGRSLRVTLNGVTSDQYPIKAGVPQGSVLGPLMWLIYFNDCLNLINESDAYADDLTLSVTCRPNQLKESTKHLSKRLNLLITWGNLWQVRFAADKTKFMVIWRASVSAYIRFGKDILENENELEVLGVIYDKSLTYASHIRSVAKNAASKITSLRRITWVVGKEAMEMLYKAQVRSVMEFAPLAWGGAAHTHLELLNKVQRRAVRLIQEEEGESTIDPLQHRRDVAGLTAMFKIHVMNCEHLHPLRQPPRLLHRPTRATAADAAHRCLQEQRCNTLHHQLQFVPRYTRLWNEFVPSSSIETFKSLQSFKCNANRWLRDRHP